MSDDNPTRSPEAVAQLIENGKATRFKEGNPGGPGRPVSMTNAIRKRLLALGSDQKRAVAEHLADNILQMALEGDDKMIKLIWNYVDGMPQQYTDITSGGKPIPILGNVQENDGNAQDNAPEETH
jgi:hypothetical protein